MDYDNIKDDIEDDTENEAMDTNVDELMQEDSDIDELNDYILNIIVHNKGSSMQASGVLYYEL